MKVCFFTYNAYALFDTNSRSHFGGMEVRATRFARGLANRPGFEVTCLVRDEGQHPRQRFDNVAVVTEPPQPDEEPTVIDLQDPKPKKRRLKRSWVNNVYLRFRSAAEHTDQFPWVRINRWDLNLAWQVPLLAMHKPFQVAWRRFDRWRFRVRPPTPHTTNVFADLQSDVVCAFGVNDLSASVVASCRKNHQKSVLFLASDQDLLEEYHYGSMVRGPHCDLGHYCWYALRNADQIVVQTEAQQALLAERFGRESTLIRNPLPDAAPARPLSGERFALWIGRAEHANKRPEMAIELARRCPEVPMLMVMNRSNADLYRELCAAAPANVQIVERVPFHEMDRYFASSAVLVNTSRREGFPNTFLQAASHGVPILSLLVDPDGFVTHGDCGEACGDDIERLAAGLRRVWHDAEYARRLGEAGRSYVKQKHALEGRVDELAELLHTMEGPSILPFALRSWRIRASEKRRAARAAA